ncbi:MAG: hypothetical protein QOH05_1252, partial [Acetobacteraceae bacterium]|nr:hypothetical protein [Acetobacteraceae bacterium]
LTEIAPVLVPPGQLYGTPGHG